MALVQTIFGTVVYLPAHCEAALRTASKIAQEQEMKQQEEDLRHLHDHLRRMNNRHVRLPKWMRIEHPDVRPEQERFVYDFFFEGEDYRYDSGKIFIVDTNYSENPEDCWQKLYQIWPTKEQSKQTETFVWDELYF